MCPYRSNEYEALFTVYDGHVDKNAAEEASQLFPKVIFIIKIYNLSYIISQQTSIKRKINKSKFYKYK